jgi:hypothetical protein
MNPNINITNGNKTFSRKPSNLKKKLSEPWSCHETFTAKNAIISEWKQLVGKYLCVEATCREIFMCS